MRKMIFTIVGVIVSMFSAQAGAQGGAQPFRLLYIGALSGPVGPVGKLLQAGLQGGVDDINARGGVLGRRIELTSEDSAGQGSRAVSILQDKLNTGYKPDVVVAGAISNETLAILPVTTQNKIVTMSITGTTLANNPQLYPYNFHATVTYSYFADFLANELKGRGFKKIGLLTSNDANGQATAKAEKDGMEKAGLTVVADTYAITDLDLTAPMQRIADARPDALVFSVLVPNAAPLILEARYKVNLEVPTFADVNTTADLAGLVAADRQKNLFIAHMKVAVYQPPEKRSPSFGRFFESVKKSGPITSTLLTPALAWDNVQAMALAFNQAGSTDPDKVKAAFENLRLPPAKDRPFMAVKGVHFTRTDHFNTEMRADDFTVIPVGPRIEGTFKPGG